MQLRRLELVGFKSFAKKTELVFDAPITAVVGPNGAGKSNVAEAFRWALGEQSLKSLRGRRGEDLIFNGVGGRLNRASVTVAFDNRDRKFNLDFDEAAITRTVHRDGINEYAINGSAVRLRDVLELLAQVSLGPTGHHIISQGEADRILTASPVERREIIEDALGLKIYHWKIRESERKLEKTAANVKQVAALRQELAPHLKFLSRQVEKIQKAEAFRRELEDLYLVYFHESARALEADQDELSQNETALSRDREKLAAVIAELAEPAPPAGTRRRAELLALEQKLGALQNHKDDLSRQLGRLEGRLETVRETGGETAGRTVAFSEIAELYDELADEWQLTENAAEAALRIALRKIRDLFTEFLDRYRRPPAAPATDQWEAEKTRLTAALESTGAEIAVLESERRSWQAAADASEAESRAQERNFYDQRAKKIELDARAAELGRQAMTLAEAKTRLDEEASEAVALTDREVLRHQTLPARLAAIKEDLPALRRQIEKLKIRLEDLGGEGAEVLAEYDQVSARDGFLAKELADLNHSLDSLNQIIADLRSKLDLEFTAGLKKIDKEFNHFFGLLFGGGEAGLTLVVEPKRRRRDAAFAATEEEELLTELEPADNPHQGEAGIIVKVNLPRKRVKSLEMLSGGERALTSIALLFAVSQVKPPPFLILDETDAALDEANSRKYADMIANLAKRSQLVLITHNRETMSRAGVLYGVTMSGDGVSRILSVRFDEAAQYAK